jgi:hypothetical protein
MTKRTKAHNKKSGGAVFVVSQRPLVPPELQEKSRSLPDYENLGELPRFYGEPILFGIARDPTQPFLFIGRSIGKTDSEIDHQSIAKVHLRVLANDGNEETRIAVEPLTGNHTFQVSRARSIYRVELGYYEPAEVWNSVAFSDAIATPPDDVSEKTEIDVATVPFHLSFQRMVDAFRGSKYDGDALIEIVSHLQKRADDSGQ